MTGFGAPTMAPSDWAGLSHFTAGEFAAPERMSRDFMMWLDGVRAAAGVPMHITSSYRTPQHNAEVGGAADSSHTDPICAAVDIGMWPTASDPNWNHARYAILRAAMDAGCVRWGIYPSGSIHLDRTEGVRPPAVAWVKVDNPADP